MANKIQYLGTGRRKTSVARVRLVPGVTGIEINGKEMREYFGGRELLAKIVEQPLELTETLNKYGVPNELIREFIDTLNECEFARYSPSDKNRAMDNLYVSAVSVITKIENLIKK